MAPVHLRLKYKFPTWNSRRACSSFSCEPEYTAPVSPYSVLFAISSA